jgi:site-specific DNA recombinase
MEKAKVGIYVRVSTEEQAKEGFSIAAQLNKLRSYCSFEEMKIEHEYIEEGWSGKNMERPQLKRLIKDIEKDKINTVVVVKLDRLTRSVRDLNALIELFDTRNIQFHSTSEKIDTTTATGRFFVNLMGSIAQLERETIIERVKDGMAQMVREGKSPGSIIPYGYKVVDTKYYIIEEEAKIIRDMYDWFVKGMSVNAIAKKLTDNHIKTPTGKTNWNRGTVRKILSNDHYIGRLTWGTTINEDSHEAILDEITFHKSLKLINIRKESQPSEFWGKYPFSGVLRCGKCGARMSGKLNHNKSKYSVVYYRCANAPIGECDAKTIREDTFEKIFLKFLTFYVNNEKELALLLESTPPEKENKVDRKLIEQDLRSIKKQISNLYSLFAKGTLNPDTIEKQIIPLEETEKHLMSQLEEIEEELPKLTLDEFKDKAKNITLNFEHSSTDKKKEMIHDLFHKITINDKTIVVERN